jgi:hypothetical protein
MTTIFASSVGWMEIKPVSIQRVAPKRARPTTKRASSASTMTAYMGTIAPDQNL